MADEIELPPYPVDRGHILAEQLKNGRGRLTSQMAALDDELAALSGVFQKAFDEADRRTSTQERIAALAKTKRNPR